MDKVMRFLINILSHIWGKGQWWLHKLFPKDISILSCGGCPNYDICKHRSINKNNICYYHTKKNREVIK